MPQVDSSMLAGAESPRSTKAVTIAEPESLSPLLRPTLTNQDQESSNKPAPQSHREHRASGAKRLSGRPSYKTSTSSLNSPNSFAQSDRSDTTGPEDASGAEGGHHAHSHYLHARPDQLVSQVIAWLHKEKQKRSHKAGLKSHPGADTGSVDGPVQSTEPGTRATLATHIRPLSGSSDGAFALEELEQILARYTGLGTNNARTPTNESKRLQLPRRFSSTRKLRRKSTVGGASSDTEYQDGDAIVPSADVILDNSKTMGYSGGAAGSTTDLSLSSKRAAKEKEGWLIFKNEIIRLAHTLRLKGWRRVPLDRGEDIHVERLSGALTNAVYVVSPPNDLPSIQVNGNSGSGSVASKRPPPKLLLRVYGPQVEHLIDRESELQILRRLARKKIGPRLLGTFTNGRFEQYFNARTLTARDLRITETSKQIAKRMRELHDGIELLEEERDAGPFIWRNWDKWVARCEEVITWVDHQILSGEAVPAESGTDKWKKRGLICGVEWSVFRKTVEKYRKWLDDQYGGPAHLKEQLVFAHNDTQYGNLLRIEPSGESPLLLPANEHKQLVVIDFEYASANMRGLEFANHFTEWCYNYHDPSNAHVCTTTAYPTPAEQYRFLKAYVQHRPQFHPGASATPKSGATPGPSSSISAFMLDSRSPPVSYAEEERKREEQTEKEIQRLMRETKLWRVANSAQWVAWGVVQAKVEGMDEALARAKRKATSTTSITKDPKRANSDADAMPTQSPVLDTTSDPLSPSHTRDKRPEGLVAEALASGQDVAREEDGGEEFDYLGYAQERAMFFWGDCLALGIVGEGDLPGEVLGKVKRVEY